MTYPRARGHIGDVEGDALGSPPPEQPEDTAHLAMSRSPAMEYSDLVDAFDDLGLDLVEVYDHSDAPAGFEVQDNGEVVGTFDTDDFTGLEAYLQQLLTEARDGDTTFQYVSRRIALKTVDALDGKLTVMDQMGIARALLCGARDGVQNAINPFLVNGELTEEAIDQLTEEQLGDVTRIVQLRKALFHLDGAMTGERREWGQ